jgi:acetoin utilization protein AcuB
MLVDSVMSRSVVTTEPARSVESAARLMREGRFRHLPVLVRGHLVAMVSDRDVMSTGERHTIREVMHTDVISITPDTPVEVAAKLMLENKIGALPVVETGRDELAGIVTQTDLFEVLARLLGGYGPTTRLEVRVTDLPRQLAEIARLACEHHAPITSLVILPPSSQKRTHRIVLRVATMVVAPFAQALHDFGMDVDHPDKLESTTVAHA